ncbi:MAG TPA: TolC family protein [Candidatus Dormibacteraeota bacterium]|jgi:outer membrane protein|nr:TolC family protein [Candidatus Dormibacteraeota bacterium]
MKSFLAIFFCALLLPLAALAQTAQTAATPSTSAPAPTRLTLADAEAVALKNNPLVTVAKLRSLISHEQVREVRSALLPDLSLNVTGVEARPDSRVAASGLNNPIIFPRAAAGATLSQLITDFGRTTNLISSSQYQAKAEEENAVATRAQILLAVDHAFYETLETQALVQVAQQTVEARQVLVDQVSALTNAKLKSDLDLSFVNVDASRSKLQLLEAENNHETSLADLSALLGYSDSQNFDLVQDGSAELQIPAQEVVPLIQAALKQRPEVNALQFEVLAEEKLSHAEHDLWRPTISALGVVGEAPVRDDHIPNWYGAAGVNINIPVFNGFRFNARAKASDLETEASRQKLIEARNDIARDVRIAWQDERRAYERLSLTRQLRDQANLALELAQARYKLGLSSIVEYTQAELQKTEADITDTDAVYQFRQTQRALDYATGALR